MKRSLIFTSIIFTAAIALNLSCNNVIQNVERKTELAKISFSVPEYEKNICDDFTLYNSARTILPRSDSASDISKFELIGSCSGSDDAIDQEFTSYSELQSSSFDLVPGTWSFTLKAFKQAGTDYKLFASGTITDVKLVSYNEANNNVQALAFTMDYSENELSTGVLSLLINVPYQKLDHAVVGGTFKGTDGTESTITETTLTPVDADDGTKSYITYQQDSAQVGLYKLKVDFYTKKGSETAEVTTSRLYFAQVQGGRTSYSEITINGDLNNKYELNYEVNLPDGETLSWPNKDNRQTDFNSSQKITLPSASELSTEHYTFDGWFASSDCSGTAVTGFEKGQTASKTVYGKWTAINYTITYNLNGGSWTTGYTAVTSFTIEDAVTLPAASNIAKENYEFYGWCSDSECTTAVDSWSAGEKGANIELYAKWTEKKAKTGTVSAAFTATSDATITFNYDSSLVTYSSGGWSVPISITVTLPDTAATIASYSWYVDGVVSGDNTTDSATLTFTSAGYYQIAAVVTDSKSNVYSKALEIQISE